MTSSWQRWGEGRWAGCLDCNFATDFCEWQGVGAAIGASIWAGIKSQIGNLASLIWNGPAGGNPIGKAITGMKNGPGGAPTAASTMPSVPISKRTLGGPVRSGGTYLVGERGPELFRSPASGHVSSTLDTVRAIKANELAGASGGGSMNVNVGGIHVHASPGQSPEAIAAAVERRMSEKLNALSRGAFSDGVY